MIELQDNEATDAFKEIVHQMPPNTVSVAHAMETFERKPPIKFAGLNDVLDLMKY